MAKLIKKRTLLEAGLVESTNTDNIIPFNNIALQVGTGDPYKVIVPSIEEVIRINAEIADSNFDIEYTYEYDNSLQGFANPLPTQDELNELYDTIGIPVIRLDGTSILLLRGSGNEISAGEGISVVEAQSGLFEVAGFSGNQLLISALKNNLPAELSSFDGRIVVLENRATNLDTTIAQIQADALVKTNDKDITGYGALTTDGNVTNGGRVARRDEITSPLASLKQEADANKVEADATKTLLTTVKNQIDINTPAIDDNSLSIINNDNEIAKNANDISTNKVSITGNTAGVTDYVNSKADFIKLEDIAGQNEIDFTVPIVMTEDGNDVVADLSTLEPAEATTIAAFVVDRLVTIQATPNTGVQFPTEYARDSWNNATGTANVILGRDITVISTYNTTTKEIRITGLVNPDRENFIRDFRLTSIAQISGSAGTGVDQSARTVANAAQAIATQASITANDAKTTANGIDTRVTKNTIDIATNKSSGTVNAGGIATNVKDIAANLVKINTKQDKVDNVLTTGSKSVVGAINETKTRVDNTEADIAELNLGKFNVVGTKITNIFDANGDLKQSITDLTPNGLNLVSQDAIYNYVHQGGLYLINVPTADGTPEYLLGAVGYKNATEATFAGIRTSTNVAINDGTLLNIGSLFTKGVFTQPAERTLVPRSASELANKRYVDGRFSSTMDVRFTDGTSGSYKIGK